MTELRVAHPVDILHGGGVALACALDGTVTADALHGLFARDTRVLSTYRIALAGGDLHLLARTREGHGTARWQYQNRPFRSDGRDVPAGSIFVELRRRVDGALHDDLEVTSFADQLIRVRLAVQIDADFADIFEVKSQRLPPRIGVRRTPTPTGMLLEWRRGDFHRALRVTFDTDVRPVITGPRVTFDLTLPHDGTWRCCVDAVPETDGRPIAVRADPHEPEVVPALPVGVTCDETLAAPFRQGCADLAALTINDDVGTFVAAGVPWFVTLFGRDTLVTSLMTGLLGHDVGRGALAALGALQATAVDDWRDAEPGKLPHELRRGELASRHLIPHTPYYGTHDAPALYCLALWNTWRWTGDPQLLGAHFPTARAALEWCDRYGDRDGDGLQEYATRSSDGYYNQGWKDAGDAIVHADGRIGSLPLATVELQGYLYAARLAMAELFEACGERTAAATQRQAAATLADLVDERFFLENEGFYALALDGTKQPLESISSNPGHLLWCGLVTPARADEVAARMLRADLFSGWGLRTLSAEHPAYNPLSYQSGSVWPHDTVIAAAGLARYGHYDGAARLLRAVLEAACTFASDRLPELFCGFARTERPPVPYADANVPQAWAAAAPILAAQVFLGLVPDAPHGRCYVNPWLPDWLDRFDIRGIRVGEGIVDFHVSQRGGHTTIDSTVRSGAVDIVVGGVAAPLWGAPRPIASRTPED
jgi:glycogen debranching enzyme